MFEITQLFFYKFLFAFELIVLEILFALKLKRRSKFPLRLVIAALAFFVGVLFLPILAYDAIFTTCLFLFIFVLSIFALKICYDESFTNLIFCCVAAYSVRHIAYLVNELIFVISGVDNDFNGNMYSSGSLIFNIDFFSFTIYLRVYIVVYALSWVIFGRRIKQNDKLYIDNLTLLWVSIFFMVVAVLINAIVIYVEPFHEKVIMTVVNIFGILSCVLILLLQFSLKGEKKLEGDLRIVEQMWQKDKQHYDLAKETIDIINVKCHDLKYQIRSMRLTGNIDDKALKDIEKSILIYDSVVKTGNDVLDVLLTEKSLFCEKHSIKLTCMADGEKLNFMNQSDIYSLFGNAIDNAIECVKKSDEVEKRFIRLTIKAVGEILAIHIENYFEGQLILKDDLPITTKTEKNYHGYGMKSMKSICDKNGGQLFLKTQDSLYMLDMLFPIR